MKYNTSLPYAKKNDNPMNILDDLIVLTNKEERISRKEFEDEYALIIKRMREMTENKSDSFESK